MKKIFIGTFLIIILCNSQNFAQELSFGVRGGITRSSLSKNFADYTNKDAITGFTGGVYLKAKVLGFFVMPELMYNERGNDFGTIGKSTIHSIDVPLLVGKQFLKIVRVNAGPNLQFQIANSTNLTGNFQDQSDFNKFAVGFLVGAGVDIWKLSLDVRYGMNLSNSGLVKFVDPSNTANINYDARANMYQIILGYRLFEVSPNPL